MMKRWTIFLVTALLGSGVLASEAVEVGPTAHEGISLGEWRTIQANQFQMLREAASQLPDSPAISLDFTAADRAEIVESNQRAAIVAPRMVGVVRPVALQADFSGFRPALATGRPTPFSGGWLRRTEMGGLAWVLRLDVFNSGGVRLRITDLQLPPGAELYLYNEAGDVRGPYLAEESDFWTHSIGGQHIYLQLLYPRIDASRFSLTRFQIHESLLLEPSPQAFCAFNAPCVVDGSCYSTDDWSSIEDARRGIANILFIKGSGGFICSGGLLNNTEGTPIPYFLTANHCLSTETVANTVEARFDFRTETCGGSCFWPNTYTTKGATLLSTSSQDDHTLLRLGENPPGAAVFLGWTTDNIANSDGVSLYRLSHPSGAPQAFSAHVVDTSAGTCFGIPRGRYIYSRSVTGATEGGSSGSPVLTSAGQVVGQLFGVCGSNINDVCDSVNNADVDGAFANYYTQVAQWLDPNGGGEPCPSSAIVTQRHDAGEWFALLYATRDQLLPTLADGSWLRSSYYRHGREVTMILLKDGSLMHEAMALLEQTRPVLEDALAGNALGFEPSVLKAMGRFADALRETASPRLANDLTLFLEKLDSSPFARMGRGTRAGGE